MNVATPPSRVLSLFSGYGGLDLGLRMATGCRAVCYVEREAFAAAVLVARMGESALDSAPVWSDVAAFDGRRWRGVVDCVAGGSPCQGNSVAGNRLGLKDPRSALWVEMLRIADETGAPFVFWENVGGAVSSALDVVTHDLEGLGYRVAACTVRASDVGATHERNRLFVLAYSDGQRRGQGRAERAGREREPALAIDGGAKSLAHGHGHGREGERRNGLLNGERAAFGNDADGRNAAVGNASGALLEGYRKQVFSRAEVSGRVGAGHRFPPPPGSAEWAHVEASAQPTIRRVVDGTPIRVDATSRNDRLRCLGNGVVPQQAAAAFLVCWQRLFGG